jgi:hypothetical protein
MVTADATFKRKNNTGQSQCSIFGGAALVTLCYTVLFLAMTVGTKNGGKKWLRQINKPLSGKSVSNNALR